MRETRQIGIGNGHTFDRMRQVPKTRPQDHREFDRLRPGALPDDLNAPQSLNAL